MLPSEEPPLKAEVHTQDADKTHFLHPFQIHTTTLHWIRLNLGKKQEKKDDDDDDQIRRRNGASCKG